MNVAFFLLHREVQSNHSYRNPMYFSPKALISTGYCWLTKAAEAPEQPLTPLCYLGTSKEHDMTDWETLTGLNWLIQSTF